MTDLTDFGTTDRRDDPPARDDMIACLRNSCPPSLRSAHGMLEAIAENDPASTPAALSAYASMLDAYADDPRSDRIDSSTARFDAAWIRDRLKNSTPAVQQARPKPDRQGEPAGVVSLSSEAA